MAARVVNRRYDRALAPAGVTTNQYAILARLDREGPQSLGVLAARLALDRTTLSRELKPLIEGGLLADMRDPGDARRRVVSLTRRGAGTVKRARPLWARAQAEIVDDFGDERTALLVHELHALVGAR